MFDFDRAVHFGMIRHLLLLEVTGRLLDFAFPLRLLLRLHEKEIPQKMDHENSSRFCFLIVTEGMGNWIILSFAFPRPWNKSETQ